MIRQLFNSFSMMAAGTAAGFALHLGLARLMTAGEYGIYQFVCSTSAVLSLLALFGLQNAVTRFIPQYLQNDTDCLLVRPLILFATLFSAGLGLVLGGLAYLLMTAAGLDETYPFATLAAGFVLVPLMCWVRINTGILRGFHKGAASIGYETTFREIGLLSGAGALLLTGLASAHAVTILVILACVLTGLGSASTLHILRLLPCRDHSRATTGAGKPPYRLWLVTALPMLLIVAAKRIMRRCDILILGLMTGPVTVGVYALAANLADGASMGSKPVLAVFSPQAAAAYHAGDTASMHHAYRKSLLFGVSVNGTICAFMAIAAPHFLPFFGEDYPSGYGVLVILLAAVTASSFFGPAGITLIMTGHERTAMKITIAAALGNVLFSPVMIALYGIEGAAMTTAVMIIGRGAACLYQLRRLKIMGVTDSQVI